MEDDQTVDDSPYSVPPRKRSLRRDGEVD